MARAAALLVIGVLLLILIVWLVARISDGVQRHKATVWRIVILVVIAAVAFWYFGNGMVYEYFNK